MNSRMCLQMFVMKSNTIIKITKCSPKMFVLNAREKKKMIFKRRCLPAWSKILFLDHLNECLTIGGGGCCGILFTALETMIILYSTELK